MYYESISALKPTSPWTVLSYSALNSGQKENKVDPQKSVLNLRKLLGRRADKP